VWSCGNAALQPRFAAGIAISSSRESFPRASPISAGGLPDIKFYCLRMPTGGAAGAQEARRAGDNGFVTGARSRNAWIMTADDEIITRR